MSKEAVTFLVFTAIIGILGFTIGKAALKAAHNTNGTDASPDANWLKTLGN